MPLPNAQPVKLAPNLTIHAPLSRYGAGPGMLIIRSPVSPNQRNGKKNLDPEPLQKWAEEGFVTVEIEVSESLQSIEDGLHQALAALSIHDKCNKKACYGLIGENDLLRLHCMRCSANLSTKVYSPSSVPDLTQIINKMDEIKAVVSYGALLERTEKPHLSHLAEAGIRSTSENEIIYRYPEVTSTSFILPTHKDFSPSSATVAHTRCLEFLKKKLDGPWFDLEEIWEEHTRLEFEARSVEDTMDTMVQEPYVNHIPTLTGGIGREELSHFYANHFIFNNPDDTALELVSRTLGIDRVVDEFIMSFTHDRMVDWL
jgi:carboxymethylenebutenolidase